MANVHCDLWKWLPVTQGWMRTSPKQQNHAWPPLCLAASSCHMATLQHHLLWQYVFFSLSLSLYRWFLNVLLSWTPFCCIPTLILCIYPLNTLLGTIIVSQWESEVTVGTDSPKRGKWRSQKDQVMFSFYMCPFLGESVSTVPSKSCSWLTGGEPGLSVVVCWGVTHQPHGSTFWDTFLLTMIVKSDYLRYLDLSDTVSHAMVKVRRSHSDGWCEH